ncbi:MAG: hypothetical protein O6851_10125, partial [Gemmatimonadetes bacterium]|nr:hypothetical protein [Gemmatimonadota bacterium]
MVLSDKEEPPKAFNPDDRRDEAPVFSPNDEWIVHVKHGQGGQEVYASRRSRRDLVQIETQGGDRPRFAEDKLTGETWLFFRRGDEVWRVEILDENEMETGAAEMFVKGVDAGAWDVLPNGSGVIALEPRPEPKLRLVLGAAALFPQK